MEDPENIPYEDLVELVRTVQATLWPHGTAQSKDGWTPDTIDAVALALGDAGLAP